MQPIRCFGFIRLPISGYPFRQWRVSFDDRFTITQHGVTELISECGQTWFRRNLGNAIVERRGDSVTTRYVYTDHLGSVDVITNDAGQVEEKLSFDAVGKRRAVFKSNNQAVNFTLASILSLTHKGYTGHEQVDHASVVQMGGRIYDKIARSNFERYAVTAPQGRGAWTRRVSPHRPLPTSRPIRTKPEQQPKL
ncbi:hypothetical protein [Aliidiomarina celeris]|uniref:hypothetical protein n=1 Tax=Aliidiomarina celeris TaxID=2249428 RepID=UPI0013006CCB|nr:hypothetical protein [Aliidiomarina celeris]